MNALPETKQTTRLRPSRSSPSCSCQCWWMRSLRPSTSAHLDGLAPLAVAEVGLGQLRLARRARLQHRIKLVPRRPAFGTVVVVGEQAALFTGSLAPVVESRSTDAPWAAIVAIGLRSGPLLLARSASFRSAGIFFMFLIRSAPRLVSGFPFSSHPR